jgi:putative DNA primase/helicase
MIDLADLARRAGGTFNGKDAMIPGPGHSKADRSLSLTIGHTGRLIAHSFAGDDDTAINEHLKSFGIDLTASRISPNALRAGEGTRPARTNDTAHLAIQVWRESVPLADTPAERYLRSREILGPLPLSLRYHPRCKDGPSFRPALIAARTQIDAPESVTSIQRTFLDANGQKIAKKSLGGCRGGCVVLGEIFDELLIAEGIETALSASAMFHMPAAATTGVSGFNSLLVPERVRLVVIAADNDENGQGLAAANSLATRLRREGREVRIETPPRAFKDFNDLANGKERSVDALRSLRGGGPPHV